MAQPLARNAHIPAMSQEDEKISLQLSSLGQKKTPMDMDGDIYIYMNDIYTHTRIYKPASKKSVKDKIGNFLFRSRSTFKSTFDCSSFSFYYEERRILITEHIHIVLVAAEAVNSLTMTSESPPIVLLLPVNTIQHEGRFLIMKRRKQERKMRKKKIAVVTKIFNPIGRHIVFTLKAE